jgi:hypothetical protein
MQQVRLSGIHLEQLPLGEAIVLSDETWSLRGKSARSGNARRTSADWLNFFP